MTEEDGSSDGPAQLKKILDDLEAQGAEPALINICWGGMTICKAADDLDDPLMAEMCSTIVSVLAGCVAETHNRRKSGGRWVLTQ
jgi:hypothetical protein